MSNRSNKWRQVGGRNRNANYNMIRVPLYTNTIINNNYGLDDKSNPPEIVSDKAILRDNIGVSGALDISGSCSGITSTNDSGYEFATLDWVNNKISSIQKSMEYIDELTKRINDTQQLVELQRQHINDLSNNTITNSVIDDVTHRVSTIQQLISELSSNTTNNTVIEDLFQRMKILQDTITQSEENINQLTMNTASNYSINQLSLRLNNAFKLFEEQKNQLANVTKNNGQVMTTVGELGIQINNTKQITDKHTNEINIVGTHLKTYEDLIFKQFLEYDKYPVLSKDIDSLTIQLNNVLKMIEQQSNDINTIGLHVRSNEEFLFNHVVNYDVTIENNNSIIQSTLLKTNSQEKQIKVLNRTINQQNNNINCIKQNMSSSETLQVPN